MAKNPNETTFLKDSIIYNRSRIDMFMANEMFGDDFEPIPEESKEGEITNLATQSSSKQRSNNETKRLHDRNERTSKKKKPNTEKELEPFESRTYQQIAIDLKKLKSLKEAYPEEYSSKLETNQDLLQKQLKTLQKEMHGVKKENIELKDMVEIYKNNYEKVLHAFEKYKKAQVITPMKTTKGESSGDDSEEFKTPPAEFDKVKEEIEHEFNSIHSQARKSNLIETFKKVDETMSRIGRNTGKSKMFHDLSSIAVDPSDLPKDIKGFVADTYDSGAEVSIPSAKATKSQISKNLGMRPSRVSNYDESTRKGQL